MCYCQECEDTNAEHRSDLHTDGLAIGACDCGLCQPINPINPIVNGYSQWLVHDQPRNIWGDK